MTRRGFHNLNDAPLSACYAFELGYIIENRREDGFRGSRARVAAARAELQRRVTAGDEKAVRVYGEIR